METCTQSPRIAKSNTPSELCDISNLEVEIVENSQKLSATIISQAYMIIVTFVP